MSIAITEDGLETQTQTEIRDERVVELKNELGANVHLDPTESLLGQLVELQSELDALTQQAMLSLYRSIDPAGAIGRPLDARVSLTGTTRKGATRSYVDGLLTFTGAATVPNGTRYRHVDTDTVWEVTDGPHTRVGAGTEAAQLTAVDSGPLEAAAASSWSVVTVIANVTGFTNPSEGATKGRDRESDTDLKRRRNTELYAQGQGPLAALQGAVSAVDGVLSVRAYHNPSTSPVDSDGIPFKAFNLVLETSPSTPTVTQRAAIALAIWGAMGAGGQAYGTDFTETIVDSEGTLQPVAFDTVDVLDVWIEIDLVTSTAEEATSPNVDDVVAAEVLARCLASHQVVGRDVRRLDYVGVVSDLLDEGTITGVDGATVRLYFDGDPALDVTKLSVGIRERASFDAARIVVVET